MKSVGALSLVGNLKSSSSLNRFQAELRSIVCSRPRAELFDVVSHDPEVPRTVERINIKNLSASEALGLILNDAVRSTHFGFLVRDFLGTKAKMHQYQGNWMLVHQLLKYCGDFDLITFELHSRKLQNEVFGNFLKMGEDALKRLKIYYVDYYRRPKKPQRKMGYNDKGSTRPSHERRPGPDCKIREMPLDFQNYQKGTKLLQFLYG